jgi:hypothetical protein
MPKCQPPKKRTKRSGHKRCVKPISALKRKPPKKKKSKK